MAAWKEVKIIVNTIQNKPGGKETKQQNQHFLLENLGFALTLMSTKIWVHE